MHHHKYNITELENMIPWERFVYIDMIKQIVKDENEKTRDQMATQRAQAKVRR